MGGYTSYAASRGQTFDHDATYKDDIPSPPPKKQLPQPTGYHHQTSRLLLPPVERIISL